MNSQSFNYGASILLFVGWGAFPQSQTNLQITADELKTHVMFLAADELEGRLSGSLGHRKAITYVGDELRRYGLSPAGDGGSYLQGFDFVSAIALGDSNSMSISIAQGPHKDLILNQDYRPFGFTLNGEVEGAVAFVGYGISAPGNSYDDYQGVNVSGKIVIALRFSPDGDNPHGELRSHGSFLAKARAARENGAKALIVVSGPLDEEDNLVPLTHDNTHTHSGIVTISMRRYVLENLFRSTGYDPAAIQRSINEKRQPQSLDFPAVRMRIRAQTAPSFVRTENVLGYIRGTDPALSQEVIVVGAHVDHLGRGGPGSGSLRPDINEVHNGADDNASGTAGLLELAQAFSGDRKPRRTLLFASFSAEELGTLGSAHYVKHPAFPLEKTVAMINLDMIGRLESDKLTVYGTGTSGRWEELLNALRADSLFQLTKVPDGFGPSDHAQFYSREVPVLFFFTGTHEDYHKPSDDWNKLNYAGMERIVSFVEKTIRVIDEEPQRLEFTRAQSTISSPNERRSFKVTLGIVPDYGDTSKGVRVSGLRPGGPAEKAGLLVDDLIVKMGAIEILNIYDYMAVLGGLKPGDETEIVVVRSGSSFKLKALMAKP